MADRLAILGGPKAIPTPFRPYSSYGPEEVAAAKTVVESGVLSRFLGSWDEDFYGGPKIREFEQAWARHFHCRHAVSVNSATSGLIAAIGAIGVEPGDEVILSPWTMSATATAILVWNALPVFADIEAETFNLDPLAVERAITPRTRAIVVTDIFGHPADLDALSLIARRHDLKLIEDAAQSPGAMYRDRYAGTVADIGVFSLNYHKHIHTGEGGMCVTDDDTLAERMQLIRNHGENVVGPKGIADSANIVGFNFRLGEIEAAMGIEQLAKLQRLIAAKMHAAERLATGLRGLPGLRPPIVKPGCSHVFYLFPMLLDPAALGVSRKRLAEALAAEGVPALAEGYVLVHRLPMYRRKIAYGGRNFPWWPQLGRADIDYNDGICPVAEDCNDRTVLALEFCAHHYTDAEVDAVIGAFRKVWNNLEALR